MNQLQIALKFYSYLSIEQLEISLNSWLDPSWGSSPYKDLFIPHLINFKLILNEQDY